MVSIIDVKTAQKGPNTSSALELDMISGSMYTLGKMESDSLPTSPSYIELKYKRSAMDKPIISV